MMNYLAGWLIFLIYLGFAIPSLRRIMNGLIDQMGDWVVTLLLIPYLLAVNFQLDWLDLLRIMIFLALPTLLLRIGSKKAKVLFQVLAIQLVSYFTCTPTMLFNISVFYNYPILVSY